MASGVGDVLFATFLKRSGKKENQSYRCFLLLFIRRKLKEGEKVFLAAASRVSRMM